MPREDHPVIAVDVDGTVVTHVYPKLGEDIGAFSWLRRFVKAGARIILCTMRDGDELRAAVELFEREGVPLYGVNEVPGQKRWTQSPKPYAQLYIDDCGFGVPLVAPGAEDAGYPRSERPYVYWEQVGPDGLAWIEKYKHDRRR